MSNVVVFTSPTLDGVMQAPGRPRRGPGTGIGTPPRRRRGPVATPRLLDSVTTTTGVLVATYQPTRTDGGTSTRVPIRTREEGSR
jgi:hypothetical protein